MLLEVRASLGLLLLLVGCSEDDDPPCSTAEPTAEGIHTAIALPSCAVSNSCHSGDNPEPLIDGPAGEEGGLTLDEVRDLCGLIDRPSVTDSQHRPLLVRGNTEASYLVIKVDPELASEITTSRELDATGEIGRGMPVRASGATSRLCSPQVAALREWVELGCPGCE